MLYYAMLSVWLFSLSQEVRKIKIKYEQRDMSLVALASFLKENTLMH